MNRVTYRATITQQKGVLYMAMELGDKRWKLKYMHRRIGPAL